MNAIRLLLLTPTYAPAWGGAEIAIQEIASRIARQGHSVDLVTPNRGGPSLEESAPLFRVHRVGRALSWRPLRLVVHQRWQYKRAHRLAKEAGFDVVASVYGVHGSLMQPRIQRRWRLPFVVLEHHLGTGSDISDPDENPAIIRPLLRRSYRRADAIVATSRSNAEFVRSLSGRTDARIIPLGADHEAIRPGLRSEPVRRRWANGRTLLLSASRLAPRKNILEMLEAVALLRARRKDFVLVLAGEGAQRSSLEVRARELGLDDVVRFAGRLAFEELAQLRASSDLALSTALFEGFGLSLAESMAAGTPVVAYQAGGTDDLLEDGVTGRVVAPDVRAFADALEELLDDERRRRQMGSACRRLVETTYNWNHCATQHVALFRDVANV